MLGRQRFLSFFKHCADKAASCKYRKKLFRQPNIMSIFIERTREGSTNNGLGHDCVFDVNREN